MSASSDDTPAAIRRAALDWMLLLRKGASPAQRRDLDGWRRADPAHEKAFLDLTSLWDMAQVAGEKVAQEEATELDGWLRAMEDRKARRRRGARLAGAALAVLLMLGGGGLWLERPSLWQDLTADAASARGERRLVALPDGSSALLDANSALDLRFDGEERRVRLRRGAAFFEVRHDGRPFVVEAAGGEIRVLGTRFEARLAGEEAVVTLATGSVAVTAGEAGPPIMLRPGERLRFGARPGAMEAVSLEQALAWREGRFTFHRMRLAEVLEEIGRYRPGRIVLLDHALGEQPVSGNFSLDEPGQALAALQASLGFSLRDIGGRLVLIGR